MTLSAWLFPLVLILLLSLQGCGDNTGNTVNTTIEVKWSKPTTVETPPALVHAEHAAAYDSINNRIIITWGKDASNFVGEVWELELLATGKVIWEKLVPSGQVIPNPRSDHTTVYDTHSKRLILFGGYSDQGNSNETWEINFTDDAVNGTWEKLTPLGEFPPARRGHTAILDEQNNRMLVFGGWDGSTTYFDDTWNISLKTEGSEKWSQISVDEKPSPRKGHTLVHDSANSRAILFGGWNGTDYLNDVWELNWASGKEIWRKLSPGGSTPTSRSGHTAVYDPVNKRMIFFGGSTTEGRQNDLWALDLSQSGKENWIKMTPTGEAPLDRDEHITVYDSLSTRMIVYGGNGDSSGEVWQVEF